MSATMNSMINAALPILFLDAYNTENSALSSFFGELAAVEAVPKTTLAIVLAVLAAVAVIYIVTRQIRWWKEFLGDMTDFFTGQNTAAGQPGSDGKKPEDSIPARAEGEQNEPERDSYD